MKRKFIAFLIALVFLIPGTIIFSACGGNGNNNSGGTESFAYIQLTDGEQTTTNLNYSYNYGDNSVFEQLNKIRVVGVYGENTVVPLTNEQLEECTFSYSYNGEAIDDFLGRTTLDAGNYYVEVRYKETSASLYVEIKKISPENLSTQYYVVIRNKDATGNVSNHDLTNSSFKYYSDFAQQDSQGFGSNYKLEVFKNSYQQINANEIGEIYVISEAKRDEYLAQKDTMTFAQRQEFLQNAHFVPAPTEENPDEKNATMLNLNMATSQSAKSVDTKYTLPGTYYLYARLELDNYNAFYTEPNTKLVVQKGDWSLTDEQLENISMHAEFDFGKCVKNRDDNFNLIDCVYKTTTDQEKALKLGDLNEEIRSLVIPTMNDYIIVDQDLNTDYTIGSDGYGTSFGSIGYFVFANSNLRVDCSDATQSDEHGNYVLVDVKFVLDENGYFYNLFNYTGTTTKQVKLYLTKGAITVPSLDLSTYYDELKGEYCIDTKNMPVPSYYYNYGDDITLKLKNYVPSNVFTTTNLTKNSSGTYTATIKLADEINYYFSDMQWEESTSEYIYTNNPHDFSINHDDMYYFGEYDNETKTISFEWKVEELDQEALNIYQMVKTINGNYEASAIVQSFEYDSNTEKNKVELKIAEYFDVDNNEKYFEERGNAFTWQILADEDNKPVNITGDELKTTTATSNTNTLYFTSINPDDDSKSGSIRIRITAPAVDGCYGAIDFELSLQIYNLSKTQVEAICTTCDVEFNFENYRYESNTAKVVLEEVSENECKIKSFTIPTNAPDDLQGTWSLCINGEQKNVDDQINDNIQIALDYVWEVVFTPNNANIAKFISYVKPENIL